MGILRVDKISGLEKERRQNPNLVTNGDFSDSSIAGWTGYNAVVSHDSGAGGRIKVDDSAGAGGWSNAAYVINTEPGASYRFEVRASATDSDTQYVGYYQGTYDTAGTAPTVYSSEITTTPSVHYFDIIATGSTVTIMLIANNNGVVYFDDVSFRKTDGNSIGGSVHFDGNDHLSIGSAGDFNFLHNGATDWTAEFWAKVPNATRQFIFGTGASSAQTGFSLTIMSSADNQSDSTGVYAQFGRGAAGNYRYWGTSSGLTVNTWHHIAAVFKSSDKTLALYIDGREVDNDSGTASGTFGTGDYSSSNSSYAFTISKNIHGNSNFVKGYISNLRVVAGRRLYTSDFTPPVYELEPIDGTAILCCNNSDSVTAVSNAGIGTAHIGTSSGNPTESTENPGFTRDFTYGTEFKGVTTFDTQGYFVPPSGTTEQRGRGRGVWAGGYQGSVDSDSTNIIEYITISSMGNSIDFGDRTTRGHGLASFSSSTLGVFIGGRIYGTSPHTSFDIIDFIQFSTTANAIDFGDIASGAAYIISGASNSTRGIVNLGSNRVYITIASKGNTQTFGTSSTSANTSTGFASPTRGFCAGGGTPSAINIIDYVTIQSTGNAQDFGDLTFTGHCMGTSNTTRAVVFSGGYPSAASSDICYITMASTGNAQDFGDLTVAMASHSAGSGCASPTRAVRAGGNASPGGDTNAIEYVTIATTGNASDFGDLTYDRHSLSGCSDSHGGLS